MPLSLGDRARSERDDGPPVAAAAGIVGIGRAVGKTVVANELVEKRIGKPAGWIERRTGIRHRHWAADDDTVLSLGAEAARRALDSCEIEAREIDMIIVATLQADAIIPNAAPLVAAEIGADRAGGIDLGAACSGWIYGVELAAGLVEAGRAQNVLVIGSEIATRLIDPHDPQTAGLFADAAGAAVIANVGEFGSIGPAIRGCDADGADTIVVPPNGKLAMRGADVFRHAVARMSATATAAVQAAGCEFDDIDYFVFHQANGRILDALTEQLGLPQQKVVAAIETYGNTSSATVPLALDDLRRDGCLRPGTRLLLAAFGAGLTWCGFVAEWRGK